jgi:hypothetical protein
MIYDRNTSPYRRIIGELERSKLYRSTYLEERVEDFTERFDTRVREVEWYIKKRKIIKHKILYVNWNWDVHRITLSKHSNVNNCQ